MPTKQRDGQFCGIKCDKHIRAPQHVVLLHFAIHRVQVAIATMFLAAFSLPLAVSHK